MRIEIPGVDSTKGLDLYDDDEEIFLTVLRSFATNVPASLDQLRNVSAETLKDYAVTVHGVKGTCANIGAEETRQAAIKLETMAKAGDLSGVLANNEAFLKQADDLIKAIQDWLEKFDANS
ncbi:MAG: Hpt domain-containing protein [Treponema sp.]|nr:Hpt domain-containing protein [Treponema sp.]